MARPSKTVDQPAVRRRPGGRSARVRRAVLDATLDALVANGFAGLTVEDIASRAGVHKTTIYRRWPDVGGLVVEAILDRQEHAVPIPDTGTLRKDLLVLLDAVAASIGSPVGQALLRAGLESGSDELDDLVHRFWHTRFKLGREIFRRAVERGEIRKGLNHGLLIEQVVAPLFFRALVSREPVSATFRVRVVDQLLAGILADGGRTADRRTRRSR